MTDRTQCPGTKSTAPEATKCRQCARATPGPDGGQWISPEVYTLTISGNSVVQCFNFEPINRASDIAASRGL